MTRRLGMRIPATRRRLAGAAGFGVWGVAFCLLVASRSVAPGWSAGRLPSTVLRAQAKSVVDSLSNPVKTVSETLAGFYKTYAQPPLLPMYRPFLVDLLTQTHLAVVDTRFKYDAIFALGVREYFFGIMGTYDKLVKSPESEKIWAAFAKSAGFDGDKLKQDGEAMIAYAKATSPSDLLKHMEGAETASEKLASEAFESIKTSLYTTSFSVGIFKLMEFSGVEVNKANVEEWAKALKIAPTKVTSDMETWRLNKQKLQMAEEMIREVEIREKKKLAERLEEKAKKLSAKAKAKETEA